MLAVMAAIVSAAFAVVVLNRWRRTRRPAFAAWAAGLGIFALAAAAQAVGSARGFDTTTFRVFYLFGGVLGVAYLALGTVHLQAPAAVARAATWGLVAVSLLVAVDMALEPVDAGQLGTPTGILGGALIHQGSPVRVAAIVLNIAGTLVLVGGSAWSAWRLARDRAGLDRVVCNLLLTIGAFVIAAGFSAAKVQGGSLDTLAVVETLGITVMFAGFLSLGRLGRRAAQRSTLPSRPAEVS
jgi:hypothetical protein